MFGYLNQFSVIKNWAPMPQVIYEVPGQFKNVIVAIYIFGLLFVGMVVNFHSPLLD